MAFAGRGGRAGGGGWAQLRGRFCGGCLGRRLLQPVLPRAGQPAGASAAEPRTGAVTDADQRSADFGGLVFGDEDFLDDAGDRRGDFGVYFVGGNLEQRLVHLYPVTYLLEPAGDGSFGDALTEGGQVNGFRHVVPVLLIDL